MLKGAGSESEAAVARQQRCWRWPGRARGFTPVQAVLFARLGCWVLGWGGVGRLAAAVAVGYHTPALFFLRVLAQDHCHVLQCDVGQLLVGMLPRQLGLGGPLFKSVWWCAARSFGFTTVVVMLAVFADTTNASECVRCWAGSDCVDGCSLLCW